MGKLSKLLAKAEQLAKTELDKLMADQGGKQQQQQAYQAPVVYQQGAAAPQGPRPFSTPPSSPPPYGGMAAPPQAHRPNTPPPVHYQQQQPQYTAPTTYSPSPTGPGRRKALLIGCTYQGTRSQLRGPGNDVNCLRYLLTTKLGFPPSSIVVLRDDDVSKGREFLPCRDVIMRAIGWLVSDLRQGDSLFFSFSGHGSQLRDPTGEEEDGFDETILPTDHKQAGQIRDTELARAIVHRLPAGVVVHALFDSCHSGTMMDLPYETKWDRSGQPYWRRNNMRGTSGGTVIQLGACDDKATAADTAKLSATAYTGAATYTFIQAIEKYGPSQTYASLLAHMTEALAGLGKSSVQNASAGSSAVAAGLPLVMGAVLGPLGLVAGAQLAAFSSMGRMTEQKPVLCCDKPIDITRTRLMI